MTFGAAERSGPLIGGLHHVGHLVRDIEEAAALYRRLGFVVPVPEFPVLPAISGQRAPVLSAGNTHIQFGANFVELATVVPDLANRPPAGAEMVMLRVSRCRRATYPTATGVSGDAAGECSEALRRCSHLGFGSCRCRRCYTNVVGIRSGVRIRKPDSTTGPTGRRYRGAFHRLRRD